MSITGYDANLSTAFSFRGICPRGCMLNVVRYTPFLTGLTLAVVLGLMLALSTSAFAMGGGGGGGSAPAPKIAKVVDPVAKPKDKVAEVKTPVVTPEDKTETKPDKRSVRFPDPNDKSAEVGDPATDSEDRTAKVNDNPADETGVVKTSVGFAALTTLIKEGQPADLQVVLGTPLSRPITLTLHRSGTAGVGDTTPFPHVVIFPQGTTTANVNFTVLDDSVAESDETITLTLGGNLPDGVIFAAQNHTVTIPANDQITEVDRKPEEETPEDGFGYAGVGIGFATSTSKVEEGDTLNLRVQIDSDRPVTDSITLEFSVLFGSRPGIDVGNLPDSLTFEPGEISKDLKLAILDDTQSEYTEVMVLTLRGRRLPSDAYFDIRTHTITIFDNDGVEDNQITEVDDIADEVVEASVGFATPTSEVERGGALVLRVKLSKPHPKPITVSVTHNAKEFITISDSLTFEPGETNKVLEFEIADWQYPDAVYVLGGYLPEGVSFGQLVHRVTIFDDDRDDALEEITTVGFTTSASEVKEGDSLLLRVELSKPLSDYLVLHALAPVGDVVISSKSPDIFFPEGETTAVVEITAVDDEQAEGTETVTYILSGGHYDYLPAGVKYATRTHTVTIVDNDGLGDDQVTEVDDPVTETKDEIGDPATVPKTNVAGTTIITTAEVAAETYPVLRWAGERSGVRQPEPITVAITSGAIDGDSVGVRVFQTGEGDLDFINSADIDNAEYGIQATSDGSGRFSITNNAKITNAVHGIDARHTGSGVLQVGVGGKGTRGWNMWAPSSFLHPVKNSEIVALQRGVFAQHSGSSWLLVEVEAEGKVVSKEGDAVVAEHDGEGKVYVRIRGEVRGARTAVVAKQNNGGNVEVRVRPGAEVYGGVTGIIAEAEQVSVYLAGEVSSGLGENGVAVDMSGTSNELVLRPGFSSNGKIVARDDARSNSLELQGPHYLDEYRNDSVERIGYLDLSDLRGFDEFRTTDNTWSAWRVTGTMSDGEAFQTAYVGDDMTLRFTDVDFKMVEGDRSSKSRGVWGYGYGTFVMDSDGVLEIVGDNMIRANLWNRVNGYASDRPYSRIQLRYPHLDLREINEFGASFIVFGSDSAGKEDRLTVTGDYKGRGFLIFDIGLDGWENDKLTIGGSTKGAYLLRDGGRGLRTNSRVLIGTPEKGTPSLEEESPVLIEVQGFSETDAFFGAQDVGAFRYVLEHEDFGEVVPDIESMRNDVIGSYFDVLSHRMSDAYWNAVWNASSREEIDELRTTYDDTLDETRKAREDAYAGRTLGDAHKALEEALASLPTEDDFDGYHTWRFRRKGPSSLAINSSALVPILSKSGEPLEKPSGSHKDRDGSGLGFRADTREYDGGIWGQRQGLRASQDLGVIADGSSRMSGERIHFGYDTPAMDLMGGDMIVGANIWHGTSASDVSSSVGTGDIDVKSQAAALTASWWSPEGLYASGQTQYIRFLSDISADGLSLVKDNEGIGMNTSAELGYRFAVPLGGIDFEFAPQAQLVWSHVGFEDFTGRQGELVSLEDGDLVTGRLGLSWDGEWRGAEGLGQFYGGMNMRGAVDGKTSVNISGFTVANEYKGLSFDGNLGLSYEWNESYAVYGEASAMHHDDVDEVRADLGVRIDF